MADRLISHLYLPRLIRAPNPKDKPDILSTIQHVLLCTDKVTRSHTHTYICMHEEEINLAGFLN
jgi:hypothetical protein